MNEYANVFTTPEGTFSLRDLEDGQGICMRCGARTVEFFDEDRQTVSRLSPKPPIGLRCRSCNMHHPLEAER